MFTAISNYVSGTVGIANSEAGALSAPNTQIGYGVGVALRALFDRLLGTRNDTTLPETTRAISKDSANTTIPFSAFYQTLFPGKTLNIFYSELDPGVDDGMALTQVLAATKSKTHAPIGKAVSLLGTVPTVGNVVLSQAETNTLQFLEITRSQNILAFPGAVAPLAIENNTAAIEALEKKINAAHFYGHDGESDVGGWPNVTMNMQTTPGYLQAALAITQSPDPITLMSTAALTELSKTLTKLVEINPEGTFAKNINAIVIRGGCINPDIGCNAPDFMPDNKKNSEISFYFDVPAVQNVFSICEDYSIPIILCPLDLTQQPGLLWTKEQVTTLKNINNNVTEQLAKISDVVPYPFARHFPTGTYPMHDLFAAAALLWPDFFEATKAAVSIGDVGQISYNQNVTESEKNVYILSMTPEKQKVFYDIILEEYNAFTCFPGATAAICHPPLSLSTILEIAIPVGAGAIGLLVIASIAIHKWRVRHQSKRLDETTKLLDEERKEKAELTDVFFVVDTGEKKAEFNNLGSEDE